MSGVIHWLHRFRRYRRWLVPAALTIGLLGAVPPALHGPASHLPKSKQKWQQSASGEQEDTLDSFSSNVNAKTALGAGKTLSGSKTSSKPADSTTLPAGTRTRTHSQSTGDSTDSSGQLLISPASVTIATPNYSPNFTVSAANHIAIHQPVLSGPKDIGFLFLKTGGEQYAYDSWTSPALRAHPEGSGVSHYTVTAVDESGKTYSGSLTVNWPPIPYFSITNVRTDLGTGTDSLGDPVKTINAHFTIIPGQNFGSHQLKMQFKLPLYPYACDGAVGIAQTVIQNGTPTNYTLSCMFVGDESAARSYGATGSVDIVSDIFSNFGEVAVPAQLPTW